MKGTIFNIEEFGVHDGPGIRIIVFFKGCPLSCTWCHNPEGISFEKELMISRNSCISCGKCTDVCNYNDCVLCGSCIPQCPLGLRHISGFEMEAGEIAGKLLRNKELLQNCGGGITLSGGEPLAQPEFLFELIKKLKPLNVAVETSGYARKEVFQEMVSAVDLVLLDIKHTDSEIHKKYTGKDNRMILENLEYLCRSGRDFYVRIPLIPGVNDTRSNMEETALLIRDAKALKRVELLPYHVSAGAKYSMLYREYKPGFDTSGPVHIYRDIFDRYNIDVMVL